MIKIDGERGRSCFEAGGIVSPITCPTCFVAGTLIHTKEGLRPIEQIKVGDWVLSQPEGKGELSYKQVTRTFVHESDDIWLVHFNYAIEKDGEKQYFPNWIVATGGHPFFTQDQGWVLAGNLAYGQKVEMANGDYASAGYVAKIFQTQTTPNVGWAPREPGAGGVRGEGYSVEFSAGGMKVEHRKGVPEASWDFEYPTFARTVYNFEVQDNHTYYVGELGLWAYEDASSTGSDSEVSPQSCNAG